MKALDIALERGDKQALIARMSQKLSSQLPGMSFGFTQPMIDGIFDMIAGAHSELVVKVFGDDLDESRRISASASRATSLSEPNSARADSGRSVRRYGAVSARTAINDK